MKKSSQSRRGVQDSGPPAVQQPEKVGWIRKFCGRGIFRELWRSRYVVLRGDHLYISDKEVKDERKAQEVFDLADYERSEELRKAKSRSKKNHSRFTVLRCRQPGNTVPNLVFLAVSPEEKESWVNALNVAIIKAKNRVLDEVTIEEDSTLVHPTRDRAKIPHGRRLPTRGHLMAVASTSSHGMLTLDLVAEEDGFCPDYDADSQESWENSFRVDLQTDAGCRGVGGRQRAGTDVSKLRVTSKEPKVKTGSLPRGSERSWGKQSHLEASKVHKTQQVQVRLLHPHRSAVSSPVLIRSELRSALKRCPTEEEAGGGASSQPVGQLQSLIAQRMQRAQELLEEMSPSGSFESSQPKTPDKHRLSPPLPTTQLSEEDEEVERTRAEAERLLEEAVSSWKEAQEVLQEVKELQSQTLRRQRFNDFNPPQCTTARRPLTPAALLSTESP
uniref:Pleckstrin homology domain-containing family O member 1-A-like n=1 Tax=Stegastes partitus TaxID=144197 RepID=A0A3B4ZT66_9TELE